VPFFQATMTRCPVALDPGFGAVVAGMVTAEGTVAALLGAVLGFGLRRVRAQRTTLPQLVRPGRIAVPAVAVLTAVLLVWPQPSGDGNGPIERATVAERNAPAPDSPEALGIWLRAGGDRHVAAINQGVGAVVGAVTPNSIDLDAMRAAAERLGIVDDAGTFPDPPGSKATEAWRACLRDTGTAARSLAAAIAGNDVPAMERAMQQLGEGFDRLVELQRLALIR
jgi:hypothetical protein